MSGFSTEWNDLYQKGLQNSIWPWSDLISYVMRYARPYKPINVLELGCGAGANIPFFTSLGVRYFGIDGSENVILGLKERFPDLSEQLLVGDFTSCFPAKNFDLIIDRAAITHNTTEAIQRTIDCTYQTLNENGIFIGIDWFSRDHSEYSSGEYVDEFTRTNYQNGQFSHVGNVHFSDENHLRNLFSKFDFLALEHKVVRNALTSTPYQFASWNISVRKR